MLITQESTRLAMEALVAFYWETGALADALKLFNKVRGAFSRSSAMSSISSCVGKKRK